MEQNEAKHPKQVLPNWRNHKFATLTAAILLAVSLLAIGLGVGIGLSRDQGSDPPSLLPNVETAAPDEDWRLDTNLYKLDIAWDLAAAPATRTWDFVISQGYGWPDG